MFDFRQLLVDEDEETDVALGCFMDGSWLEITKQGSMWKYLELSSSMFRQRVMKLRKHMSDGFPAQSRPGGHTQNRTRIFGRQYPRSQKTSS